MVCPLNCIVAVSQNMGIGKNGDLPWPPLGNEFKYFQRMTTTSSVGGKQNLVIMGRKTWFSIAKKNQPLKDRINIVLSRELQEPPQGTHFLAKSLDDALKLIEQPELAHKVDMVWVVGGSSVYKEAMNRPGHLRLLVTRLMQEFESDTFFPEVDLEKYKLLPEYPGVLSDIQEEKGIKYKFEVYEKNN
ncbi:LOW QUALITY PROTEIN: dihydrofolate reductase-like [Neofelis nebulosa]|uniref:LOW QUALITY PROTEIN: dihydrofolate reductase-like n=1 Tax=Neofelis nebulosa TaxID=61452 RepID=UPI00272B193F|nr:LOW QUALITY PROTEIN: dihydrofolate reductase-like [Neofelis nebulosa]